MHKRPPVALKALHDESFAAEQPDAELALKRDTDATPFAAARNESFCAINSPPISARWTATILPGYGAPKATFRFWPDGSGKLS